MVRRGLQGGWGRGGAQINEEGSRGPGFINYHELLSKFPSPALAGDEFLKPGWMSS